AHVPADRAREPWRPRLHGDQTPLRNKPRDLQHQLGAGRLLELLALADGDDERAGAADDAVLVIDIEIIDIHRERIRPLQHDRQPIDGNPGSEHVVARYRDEGPAIVGTIAGAIDDAPKADIA